MNKRAFRNYADKQVFEDACQRFGGRKHLEEKYPEILKLLENTREWHQSLLSDEQSGAENIMHPSSICQVKFMIRLTKKYLTHMRCPIQTVIG